MLTAFFVFKIGDIFSPWFITTGVWLAILLMFTQYGDMLYHLEVLLTSKGLRIEDIALELQKRHDPNWDAQRRKAKASAQ